jgi:hypothetical protein
MTTAIFLFFWHWHWRYVGVDKFRVLAGWLMMAICAPSRGFMFQPVAENVWNIGNVGISILIFISSNIFNYCWRLVDD